MIYEFLDYFPEGQTLKTAQQLSIIQKLYELLHPFNSLDHVTNNKSITRNRTELLKLIENKFIYESEELDKIFIEYQDLTALGNTGDLAVKTINSYYFHFPLDC